MSPNTQHTNSQKHCLVTGGAGFIGSHLVDRLVADRHKVTVLDNFSTGRRENLSQHARDPNVRIVEADIGQLEAIERYFVGTDWVFHLAALADIVPSIQQPMKYHHSNVDGTIAVLEAARRANVQRFMYAASSSCYGIPDSFPTNENAPARPMYPYALTKYVGEQYVLHWHNVYKLPAVSLRFFNVYGPRARTSGTYGAVFGVFLAQKLKGELMTVVGDGTQTRDFTYVTDLADALVTAAQSDLVGEILNVGSGGAYSINSLIDLLGGTATYIPKRPGEPDCTFADISKIQRLLGWNPKVGFEEGVAKMLEHIDDWTNAPVWTPQTIEVATKEWHQFLGEAKNS